ncbi:hypothetical protein ABTX77_02515, partial [Streptomyces sp. NPDC097704]|uniref:hypothetical protein n=1 Tax=Streptomyces sp. NPDC097704 TaxID=3157101 RepID=UPI00332EC520
MTDGVVARVPVEAEGDVREPVHGVPLQADEPVQGLRVTEDHPAPVHGQIAEVYEVGAPLCRPREPQADLQDGDRRLAVERGRRRLGAYGKGPVHRGGNRDRLAVPGLRLAVLGQAQVRTAGPGGDEPPV